MSSTRFILVLVALATSPPVASAQVPDGEITQLRALLSEIRADYDSRISQLEERLARAERMASGAQRDADEAVELAEQTAIDQSGGVAAPNTFNPSIGAILSGGYTDVDRGWSEIPGFQAGGEIGTPGSGFSSGEAEINLKANVDSRFYSNLTLGLHEDEGSVEIEIEEAWLQTLNLPAGLTVTAGRFFSAAGYLNSFHFHADDFVDRPLPYQAFFGGRYFVDGVQTRWVAPANILLEFGAEMNWGGAFPATANGENSPGAWTLFSKIGGDLGANQSWQIGLSHTSADAVDRSAGHEHEVAEDDAAFSGDSDLTSLELVWKWSPQGNPGLRNLKLQGEYFRRSEDGVFAGLDYDAKQTGWYLQGVYQFAPLWRAGLRHDVVDADNGPLLIGTALEDPGRSPVRDSVMLDFSPSEFSRLRLQYTNDRVLAGSDSQLYLQYIMSIGAHGAHQF